MDLETQNKTLNNLVENLNSGIMMRKEKIFSKSNPLNRKTKIVATLGYHNII